MDKIENIYGVDHIGYAVKNIDTAREYFSAFGYVFGDVKADASRSVNVCVGEMQWGGVKVELLAPMRERKSPVDVYLRKVGSTPYHICYKVEDMQQCVARLQETGFTVLGLPAPSEPLSGDVCFLYSPETGVIELIEFAGAVR